MDLNGQSQSFSVGLALDMVGKTRSLLSNGNTNPYGHVPGSQFRSEYVNVVRDLLGQARSQLNVGGTPLQRVLCDAKIAIGAKTGNCGEHASVAFALLYIEGYYPIYKCAFPGKWDHAFVMLGSKDKPLAICDPWANVGCAFSCWTDWKKYIWGNVIPKDNDLVIVAEDTEGGSQNLYELWTKDQESFDGMDVSA